MAVDKLVDSAQLDADLTSVANAIRTKGGTSASLAFPAGFVSAVQAIPTGITPTGTKQISITQNGTTTEDVTNYANAEITVNVSGGGGYSMDDIIDRTPITGAVTYSGNTTTLAYGCLSETNITSFTSSSIVSAFDYAFYKCKYLETVDMPNFAPSATNVAGHAFEQCERLRTVKIPKFKRAGGSVFQYCKALEMLVLPSVDYQLGTYFANNCTALHTVDVGGGYSGNFAGGNAFSYTGLTTLIIRITGSVLSVGNNVFSNSPLAANGSGGDIYVPSALKSSYQSASNWSSLNATWHAIEGSYYETHYADGTVIS